MRSQVFGPYHVASDLIQTTSKTSRGQLDIDKEFCTVTPKEAKNPSPDVDGFLPLLMTQTLPIFFALYLARPSDEGKRTKLP